MIEVRCNETGDWAEAPDPESAVRAARQLAEDAKWATGGGRRKVVIQGVRYTFRFEVDGQVVAGALAVPESALHGMRV
jgi:hypothetical protein